MDVAQSSFGITVDTILWKTKLEELIIRRIN
jgi:hypothetical protein